MRFIRNFIGHSPEVSRNSVRAIAAAIAFLLLTPAGNAAAPNAANMDDSAILEQLASWQWQLDRVRLQRMQLQAARQQISARFGTLITILNALDPQSPQAQALLIQISQIQAYDAALERQIGHLDSQEVIIHREIDRLRRIIGRK